MQNKWIGHLEKYTQFSIFGDTCSEIDLKFQEVTKTFPHGKFLRILDKFYKQI